MSFYIQCEKLSRHRERLWSRRSFPNSSSRYKARTDTLAFPLSGTDHISHGAPAAHGSGKVAHAFSHRSRARALTFGVPQLLHSLDGCRSQPALVRESLRPAAKGLKPASHHATLLTGAT